MSKSDPAQSVRMRVLVVEPPPGVRFAVQRGRTELLEPSVEQIDAIQFDFSLRLGAPRPDGSINFLGEFAQGPTSDRFLYINSGTLAGQANSCWTRRAKLKLGAVPRDFVEAAVTDGAIIIQAHVFGTIGDGGPVCASVKQRDGMWSLVQNLV